MALGCLVAVVVGNRSTAGVAPVASRAAAPVAAVAPARIAAAAPVAPRRMGPSPFEIEIAPVMLDGGLHVLLAGEVDERWLQGAGAPSMVEDEGLKVVTHPLGPGGRSAFAAAVGARLRLFRADGSSCLARVDAVVGLARLDDGGELGRSHGARTAWEAAGGAQVVAGRLEPIEGRCDDARFARSDSLPAPAIARPEKAPPSLERRVVPALLALPSVRDLFDGPAPGDSPVEVVTFGADRETLVVATLFGEGCTGNEPLLVAAWRLGRGDSLEPLGPEIGASTPVLAAGTGPDGGFELVVPADVIGSALLRRTGEGGRLELGAAAPVAILGCRC